MFQIDFYQKISLEEFIAESQEKNQKQYFIKYFEELPSDDSNKN